jgi:hypothetical protein
VSERERVCDFWDEHVARWLDGRDVLAEPLPGWFASFQHAVPGAVAVDGLVEPFQGDLRGGTAPPAFVLLGLGPGRYYPDFQVLCSVAPEPVEGDLGEAGERVLVGVESPGEV